MKFRQNSRQSRGDTMVEVMLSMAIIAMVIGAAYAVSNRATQLNRLAQQRTQVNNLMRSQAEYLRAMRDKNDAKWSTGANAVLKKISGAKLPSGEVTCATKSTNAFHVDKNGYQSDVKSDAPPYDIWIVPDRHDDPSDTYKFTDFYIIGCWQGPGSYGQQRSFIVERLNDEP